MQALKFSSDADEKKQLKSQCGLLMDVADRIKNAKDWTPIVQQQLKNTKHAQIGQWAATVDASERPGPAYDEATSPPSSFLQSNSPTAAPTSTHSTPGKLPVLSVSGSPQNTLDQSMNPYFDQDDLISFIDFPSKHPSQLHDNGRMAEADLLHKDNSEAHGGVKSNVDTSFETFGMVAQPLTPSSPLVQHQPSNKSNTTAAAAVAAAAQPASSMPIAPTLASRSHIHRLIEPRSTRMRSRKEEIILLKASVVNGFKCPPWEKIPGPAEFTLQDGQELFR